MTHDCKHSLFYLYRNTHVELNKNADNQQPNMLGILHYIRFRSILTDMSSFLQICHLTVIFDIFYKNEHLLIKRFNL